MGIGERINFIKEGELEWQGSSKDVISSTNEDFNDFVFASDLFKKVKAAENEGIKLT